MIVLDASALLATIENERGGYELIERARGGAMSAVNWCEVLTKVVDRGRSRDGFETIASYLGLRCLAFDQTQAELAAVLRTTTRRAGLSLGDRACLALGKTLGVPVITADRAWANLDLGIDVELIR